MADSNISGQQAFQQASGDIDTKTINQASKAIETPEIEQEPVQEKNAPQEQETVIPASSQAETIEQVEQESQFTPISQGMSFTERANQAIESGEVEYPTFRPLSQEEKTSYEKAMSNPEYQRIAKKAYQSLTGKNTTEDTMLRVAEILTEEKNELPFGNIDLEKLQDEGQTEVLNLIMTSPEMQDVFKRAGQKDLLIAKKPLSFWKTLEDQLKRGHASDFSFANKEVELGELISALSSGDLKETGGAAAVLTGGAVGATQGAKVGATVGLPVVGSVVGGAVGAFGASGAYKTVFGGSADEEIAKKRDDVKTRLFNKEITIEQAEKELQGIKTEENKYQKDRTDKNYGQTLAQAMIQAGMNRIEKQTANLPELTAQDESGWRGVERKIVGGADSMGTLLLEGMIGKKVIGNSIASKKLKAKVDSLPEGREISQAVKNRYKEQVSGKIGGDVVRGSMALDITGQGAVEDIQTYIERTGDKDLNYYQGDLSKVALNLASAYLQDVIEQKWGVTKFIKNPRQATKWGEWANGFIQEFTQGETTDIAEWTKGNQDFQDVLKNTWNNIQDGLVGGLTQGALGTGVYAYNHKKAVNDLADKLQDFAPNKTTKEIQEFADKKVTELEEEVAVDMVKDIVDFADATTDQGKIYNTVKTAITKAINDQREKMKDTLDGSRYDYMSEDELAQHIESVTQDEMDKIVIESLENGIPLSESPRLKGITIDGTYYIEGADYAQRTAEAERQNRERINALIFAQKQAEKDAKQAEKDAKKELRKVQREQERINNQIKKEQQQAEDIKFNLSIKYATDESLRTALKNAKWDERIVKKMSSAELRRAVKTIKNLDINTLEQKSVLQSTTENAKKETKDSKSITPKSIFHQKINKEFALKSGIMYAWGYNEKDPATNLVFTSKGGISDWGGILLGLQDRGILPPAETNETAEQVDANTEKAKAIVLNNQDTNIESIQESAELDLITTEGYDILRANDFTDEKLQSMSVKEINDKLIELAPKTAEPELTEEQLAGIPDDLKFQSDFNSNESLKSLKSLEKDLIMSGKLTDLSKDFKKNPTIDDVKEYIKHIFNNGSVYATLSPDWLIDLQGNTEHKKHIIYSERYKDMQKQEKNRHNKYAMALKKIINKALYDHSTPNTKNETKPNIAKYHYFISYVKINDMIYTIILDTEERVGENTKKPQTVHLYNIKEVLATRANEFNDTSTSNGSIINFLSDDVKNRLKDFQQDKKVKEKNNNLQFQNNQVGKGGAYDPTTRSITLGGKADATTLPHELAHYWIDKNFKWARSGKASQEWKRQWQAVEKWLGIDPEDKVLSKQASEKFARAYEKFLGEEKAPLVLEKSFGDFRDFVLDHYDYDLDEAKGLQDAFGRPIQLNDDAKNWFRKTVYDSYSSPTEKIIVNQRIKEDEKESIIAGTEINNTESESIQVANEIIDSTPIKTEEIKEINKRTIGGGEEKESKGKIASQLNKTYESTSWEIQERLVEDYLNKVSLDEALDDLYNETYPEKIDPNFLRQALSNKLLDANREEEAIALIEETAESFTMAAQQLQSARRLTTPFTETITQLTQRKAERLARAKFGKWKSLEKLDKRFDELVAKYETMFVNAKTDEERQAVFDAMQAEAVRTIGTLNKSKDTGLLFQDDEKDTRQELKAIKQAQKRRSSIAMYRAKAKRLLKEATGITPTREQVKDIRKMSADVNKAINQYRKSIRENKASAIDPTQVLESMNKLNNYLNSSVGESKLSKFADATNSFASANMLWNVATNAFNVWSTWVQMIPHMLANKINNKESSISWDTKRKIIQNALKIQLKTGYNIFSLQDFMSNKTIWAEKYYEATSKIGKGIRAPLTALGLMDTMNKGIVFLDTLDRLATARAKETGKSAEDLFYQGLNTDPRTISVDGLKIRQQAVLEGEEATFTQSTDLAKAVNTVRKVLNLGYKTGFGNFLMPFTTTIANIADDAIKNYALGSVRSILLNPKSFLNALNPKLDAEFRKAEWKKVKPQTKNVLKNIIGITILLALALKDGDDDDFVLDYSNSTDIDKDIRQNRNAPSEFAVRIGNKWVSLELFGIGSIFAKMYLTAKRHAFTTDGWVRSGKAMIDLIPGISEINDLLKAIDDPLKGKTLSERITNYFDESSSELLTRMIPASALVNQIGNIEDTTKRETWNRWYDKALGKIPFARRLLPERLSSKTGEVLKQTDTIANLVSGQRLKDYVPATPADKARYEFYIAGKGLNYNEGASKLKELGKDTPEFKKAVAEVRKDFTKTLGQVANNPQYQALDTDEKRKLVNKLHTESLEKVKIKYGLVKPKKTNKNKSKKKG